MLTSDLPMYANASRATLRLRIRPGKESERVKEALPESFRETLKVQRIDTPLSLRHVVQAPAALLKRVIQREEASVMASLTESITKVPEINIGKERLRESTSAPYLKVLSAQLPPVLAPRSSAPGSSTKSRPKDPLIQRRHVQLHRHAIDFNSGHRIRLLRRTKPSLKPLLV